MLKEKNVKIFLQDVLESSEKIINYTKDMDLRNLRVMRRRKTPF